MTATLRDGRVHQLDSPASLLGFTPLPMVDRLRMGAALAVLKAMPNPRLLEGTGRWTGSAAGWVAARPRSSGSRCCAESSAMRPTEIAMPWFWARVHDRTQALGYLSGGFQQLYDRMAERVRSTGGETRFGTAVSLVKTDGDGFLVETDDGAERFDRVISTFATRLTARLVPELPDAWRERHEWGRAYGAHCLILALDRPLTDVYWLNINDPGFPFMALVEHTNYQPAHAYGGRHLIYLGNYRPMDDPLMSASHGEVLDQFLPSLARLNPEFDRSWLVDSWSFKAPFAQPIVTVDYRDHIPPFHTPIPNLWTASMFQVYPHDRGQNYSIALAERLVERIGG